MDNRDTAFVKFNDVLDDLLQQTRKEVIDFETGALSEQAARIKIGQHKGQAQLLQLQLHSVRTFRPTIVIENRISPQITDSKDSAARTEGASA
jgi:hypothetical protein